jgi:hypothetical protein
MWAEILHMSSCFEATQLMLLVQYLEYKQLACVGLSCEVEIEIPVCRVVFNTVEGLKRHTKVVQI